MSNYKKQEIEYNNIIVVYCKNCGEIYEEIPLRLNMDYSILSRCPYCNVLNNL